MTPFGGGYLSGYSLYRDRKFAKFGRRGVWVYTKERGGTWRIKANDDLDKLIRHKNAINYIKSQRLSSFGHLH